MTRIYFVCGFIGSGKTTYSKAIAEKHGAFRFSIDEWMIPLYGEHMEREVLIAGWLRFKVYSRTLQCSSFLWVFR